MNYKKVLKISRPRFWVYEFGAFWGLGIFAGLSSIYIMPDNLWLILIFAFYFLIPANILIYGVNDIFDYETDKLNPKKIRVFCILLVIFTLSILFYFYNKDKKVNIPESTLVLSKVKNSETLISNKKILLTSGGFNSEGIIQKFKELASSVPSQSVAIITTASYDKEKDEYAVLAYKQFVEMGFTDIDFVDMEISPNIDFSKYGIIYVCGGNTFTLLKYAKESNLKLSIDNLLNRGGVYVGVSAGSIIAGPSIASAAVNGDENYVELTDLSGLKLTETIIYPHYNDNKGDGEIKKFEIANNVTLKKLSDAQALVIQNGVESLVE